MLKNKKILNDKGALESAGVLSIEDYKPSKIFTTDMTALAAYWRDLDCQRFISRYEWHGLPKNIPAWRLEQMLYYRGSLVLYKVGKDFFLLPYACTKGVNLIGLPNAIYPVSYNGEKTDDSQVVKGIDLSINNKGEFNGNAKAVILYDRYNGFWTSGQLARYALSLPIIQEICNRLAFGGINLINSQGKYVIVCKDEKAARVVEKQLDELMNSTSNYALIRSMFEIQIINNKVDYQEQQIWEDVASWNSLLCDGIGVQHNGLFNKKERTIEGELSGANTQTNLILMNGLKARRDFVIQVKELFGEDPDFKEQFGEDFGVDLSTLENYQEQEDRVYEEEQGEKKNEFTNNNKF